MHLAEVIGRVVATQKVDGLRGVKLLLVQPVDHNRAPKGDPIVVPDGAEQSGPVDLVMLCNGREACYALSDPFVPVDAGIVGIVDSLYAMPLEVASLNSHRLSATCRAR